MKRQRVLTLRRSAIKLRPRPAALKHRWRTGGQIIGIDMLKSFVRRAKDKLRLEGGGYHRDHLRALAQRVEVADDEVRIM